MKRTAALLLSLIFVIALAAGCGNNNDKAASGSEGSYKDGLYYAEGPIDEKSGWKELVALKVEKGKITSVNWNGLHRDGGLDKKSVSAAGGYGLVAKGGAQAEWHEQAMKAEQYLLDKQDPKLITFNAEDGKTDAITGVSIHVNGLVELASQALEAGPVQAGPYKDSTYHAEGEFDAKSGWKEVVDLTVINGKIAAVRWNAVHKDGGTDKVTRDKAGEYGMKEKGAAQADWYEQALKTEQYLLEKQDPSSISFNAEDGKTDAISGVSIHVNGFVELAAKALEGAK